MLSSVDTLPEGRSTPHAGQEIVAAQERRFNWLAAGRRWRKTTLAVGLARKEAHRGGQVLWAAPTYDQVRIGWTMMKRAYPHHVHYVESRYEAIFLESGGCVRFRSLDHPDHVRGHTAHGVVVDEAADVAPAAWHEVLRPMLISTRGWAWLIGTPKGRNWFWQEWVRAGDDPEAAAWQAPLLGAAIEDGRLVRRPHPLEHPGIPWSELVALWRAMPERAFRQEILAEFLDDGGGVFRGVRAAARLAPGVPDPRREYVVGVDWGRSHDFTVYCVLDQTGAQVALDRFTGVDAVTAIDRLVALDQRWRPSVVLAESNAMGGPIIDALLRAGVPVQGFATTAGSKQRLIDALALAFEQGRVVLLDHPVQTAELEAYTTAPLPGGGFRYGAPAGLHDDTVMALALAWSQLPAELSPPEEAPEPELMRDRPGLLQAFPGLKRRWE